MLDSNPSRPVRGGREVGPGRVRSALPLPGLPLSGMPQSVPAPAPSSAPAIPPYHPAQGGTESCASA